MTIVPLTIREACAFVAAHHRHHRPPQGALFALGVASDIRILGVALAGRPVARLADDGFTLELTRVCVLEGQRNVCSKLYAAAWRAARALGYLRCITYTLPSESGSSPRGAGWHLLGEAGGGTWSRSSRPRVDMHPTQTKLCWERNVQA